MLEDVSSLVLREGLIRSSYYLSATKTIAVVNYLRLLYFDYASRAIESG